MQVRHPFTIAFLVLGVASSTFAAQAQTQTAIDAMRQYPAYRHAVESVIQQ